MYSCPSDEYKDWHQVQIVSCTFLSLVVMYQHLHNKHLNNRMCLSLIRNLCSGDSSIWNNSLLLDMMETVGILDASCSILNTHVCISTLVTSSVNTHSSSAKHVIVKKRILFKGTCHLLHNCLLFVKGQRRSPYSRRAKQPVLF